MSVARIGKMQRSMFSFLYVIKGALWAAVLFLVSLLVLGGCAGKKGTADFPTFDAEHSAAAGPDARKHRRGNAKCDRPGCADIGNGYLHNGRWQSDSGARRLPAPLSPLDREAQGNTFSSCAEIFHLSDDVGHSAPVRCRLKALSGLPQPEKMLAHVPFLSDLIDTV
jgi:hypothetical protein